jgi:hypothetical protein
MSSIPRDKDESVSATPPELRGFRDRKLDGAWEPVPDIRAPKHRKTWWQWPTRSTWANVVFAVIVVTSIAVMGTFFYLFRKTEEDIRRHNESLPSFFRQDKL